MRARGRLVVVAVAAVSLLILAGAAPSQDEILSVRVLNFPSTQQVAGSVSVEGVVRHAQMHRLAEVVVPPVRPTETTRLVQAGTIPADGFTSIILSLDGQTRGKVLQSGAIGCILIPDEESVGRAFEDEGLTPFRLDLTAPSVSGASVHFASGSERLTVAFPRYRVLLYNTTDKSASVNVYAYLTH